MASSSMTQQCMPCNGEIIVNEFKGDAVFRTGGFSYVSTRIAEGLVIGHSPVSNEERGPWRRRREFPYVIAKIELGSKKLVLDFPMLLMEGVFKDMADQSPWAFMKVSEGNDNSHYEPPEVMLGLDFFKLMGTFEMKDDFFTFGKAGDVPKGSMRPFRKIENFNVSRINHFPLGSTYATVNDRRIILLFDMDSFEVQVHQKPGHIGKPRVVTNPSGRVLAVSFDAKKLGITRDATPYIDQARRRLPDIIEIQVPSKPGRYQGLPPRPDTRIAREASARIQAAILHSLQKYGADLYKFELSSNDEFFLDVTKLVDKEEQKQPLQFDDLWKPTFLYNETVDVEPRHDYVEMRLHNILSRRNKGLQPVSVSETQEIRLLLGAKIASDIIRVILEKTGFQSSVGVGANKLMAKIASSVHKPGSITVTAPSGFPTFSQIIKVGDIPTLGGKTGEDISRRFVVDNMCQLNRISVRALSNYLNDESRAVQFLEKGNGICQELVVHKLCHETASCSRNPQGKFYSYLDVTNILWDCCNDILERILFEERVNHRIPNKIKLSITSSKRSGVLSVIEFNKSKWRRCFQSTLQNQEDVLLDLFKGSCIPRFDSCAETELKEIKIIASF